MICIQKWKKYMNKNSIVREKCCPLSHSKLHVDLENKVEVTKI